MHRRRLLLIYFFVAVGIGMLLLSAAIGIYKLRGSSDTSIADDFVLPDFVNGQDAPEGAAEAYRGAVRYPDQFSLIPCYCNCGEHAGHRSLLDCFIDERNRDEITFDRHGAGWKLCVDVALDALEGIEADNDISQIRADIENKYEGKFGEPTATPSP